MKMGVNGGELSILQHSLLLGTDALDATETALKLGSHGQKKQSIACGKCRQQRRQQEALRKSDRSKNSWALEGIQGCDLTHLYGRAIGGNLDGLFPLILA